jgi:hypothetical protein
VACGGSGCVGADGDSAALGSLDSTLGERPILNIEIIPPSKGVDSRRAAGTCVGAWAGKVPRGAARVGPNGVGFCLS